MTWHHKGTGVNIHVPLPMPKPAPAPKPAKPAAPPKSAAKAGKTAVYAAKKPNFGHKIAPVKTGKIH